MTESNSLILIEELTAQNTALKAQNDAFLNESKNSETAILKYVKELEIHDIELEAQNQELLQTIEKAELANQKYLDLYDFSSLGFLTITEEGIIEQTNLSSCRFINKEKTEVIHSKLESYLTFESRKIFSDFLKEIFTKRNKVFCDVEIYNSNSGNYYLEITGKISKSTGKCYLTLKDISDNQLLKTNILERDFIFKEMQRIGHIGSFKFDLETKITTEMSETLCYILGIENKTILNQNSWLELIHPEDIDKIITYSTNLLREKLPFQMEFRIVRKIDNEVLWVDGRGEVIFDTLAKCYYMIGIIQDITDRKRAEEKIEHAETRSHRIFESSKEGILILDAISGQITDANPFLISMIGFNYEELVGKELWEIGVFKNIAASKDAFIELQNKEYIRFEDMPLETKAGKSIDVEFVSNVYMVDQKKVILCHIRDISIRKKVDEALKESSQLYFAMFETNQAVQLLIDPKDGRIVDVNLAAAIFYGYSLEEFKLMNLSDISTYPLEKAREELAKLSLAGQSYFQFVHKLASGETCDIEVYTSPLLIGGQPLLISTINNITKRKLEEERLMQLNFKLNEVNLLKSQFISTVSHEFRTPLAGILSSVQLLKIYSNVWDSTKKDKMYKQIFDAVQHTKALLNDVSLIDEEQNNKLYFRPKNLELIPLINEIIEENLAISSTHHNVVLRNNIKIESCNMDPIMIRHIFNNILSNAIKYSDENQEITIDIDETENNEIKFVIEDHGIGIPAEDIKYLLEPFYRASNIGIIKGTGFGLSIVKRFVELHKGEIVIESVIEKGTKVTIILPYSVVEIEAEEVEAAI